MLARVQDNGETSEAFPVTNRVKQGCLLATTLFSLMFSAMLSHAFRDSVVGIGIKYRTNGSLFNLRRLKVKTKAKVSTTNDFLFADDMNVVDKFTYLGSTLARSVIIDDELNARLAKASAAFDRLNKKVWNRRGITAKTKVKVYLTTLLYGCETWIVYQRHARKLNHFQTTCLRRILSLKWQEKIPDTEVLTQADLPSVYTILMQSQLHWAGHMVGMADHRLPKKMLFGELLEGKCSQVGQKKHFKDTLKIEHTDWKQVAQDRDKWHGAVKRGAKACEANRTAAAEQRRQVRKGTVTPAAVSIIPCPHCPRLFRALIGLTSHLQPHRKRISRHIASGPHAQCRPPKLASSSPLSSSFSPSPSIRCVDGPRRINGQTTFKGWTLQCYLALHFCTEL